MSGFIITAVIAIPFLILAIALLNGKGAFLIAGFNTMSDEKRATYDEKALCSAVGWLLIALLVLMFLFPIAIWLQQMWLFWLSFTLIMVLTFGFAIYANTGNRFRKSALPEETSEIRERKSEPKGKKLAIIIIIAMSVLILIGVGIMIFLGERDPVVTIHNDSIKISALYGLTINYSDIEYITLLGKNMRGIGVGTRINGYSTSGQALKGNFSSAEHGQHLLFVYSSSSPTIQIVRANGVDVFISYRDSEKTREIYRVLSAWIIELDSADKPPATLTDDNLLAFSKAESVMSYTPVNNSGLHFRDLSGEEIKILFHNLNIPRNVNASFISNGALDSITAEYDSGMVLGVGQHHGNTMLAYSPGIPTVTDVHSIPVTALFAEISHPDGIFFQAYFIIDDTRYDITLRESDLSIGKEKLSEAVISIIANNGIDFTSVHNEVSVHFSIEEVGEALDLVRKAFEEDDDWRNCELVALWYDEAFSETEKRGYMTSGMGSVNGVGADNIIILLSDFYVSPTGACPSLNPDSVYQNWSWILIRDSSNSAWRIDDWGY